MGELKMPILGADMEFGTVLEWQVKPGDEVRRGDIVAVIDTSKAEIEIEVFEDGVIEELLVPEGRRVPVGTPIAMVHASAAAMPAAPPPVQPSLDRGADGHRSSASPLARRIAADLGVDLAMIAGSGPGGAITKADVLHAAGGQAPTGAAATPASAHAPGAAAAAPSAPPTLPTPSEAHTGERTPRTPPRSQRQDEMRQAIGALMARSKREIPHYYLQTEIDMSQSLAWLAEENRRRPVAERLLSSALLLCAVARALAHSPGLSGHWIDGAFRPADGVHIGVAISLRGGGLIAPALHDADRKSLDELMASLRDLVARARAGRLRGSEMSDAAITVTNLGEQAVDLVHGVIYPPQVALVGFGGIRERPWAADGMLGARATVNATLAGDHRASDGHLGSRFLAAIEELLQAPERL